MRKLLLFVLALLPGVAGAQDFIHYYPASGGTSYSNLFAGTNTLQERSGTNAQSFQIFNTYTDGSNYEVASLNWTTNVFRLTLDKAGTGSYRTFAIKLSNFDALTLDSSSLTLGVSLGGGYTASVGTNGAPFGQGYISKAISGCGAGSSKSLTDAGAAVSYIRVPIANNAGGGGEVIWTANSTDGTDYRVLNGRVRISGVNKGGTATCAVNVVGTDLLASSNANTLACTWSAAASTTNCDAQVTCTDNTAGTQTMSICGRLDSPTSLASAPVFP